MIVRGVFLLIRLTASIVNSCVEPRQACLLSRGGKERARAEHEGTFEHRACLSEIVDWRPNAKTGEAVVRHGVFSRFDSANCHSPLPSDYAVWRVPTNSLSKNFLEAHRVADNPSPLDPKTYRATVLGLLSGHWGILLFGLAAVGAETGASLLEPWPIKIVLDTVLRAKPLPQWLERAVASMLGTNVLGVLEFAVGMVLLIAIVGGVGSYVEKQCVTTLGQRVTHELRSRIYTHAQRLSMSFHDKKRTGDIISTATADVDAIQSAITSGVLDTLYYTLLLIGMSGLMLYLDWRFTLIALAVLPALSVVVYTLTRRIKRTSLDVRGREADLMSTMHEVLSSMRLVKAFGREDHERGRFEYQSEQIVAATLRARDVKAKLAPAVEIIVAVGSGAVLWFGARHVLDGRLTAGALVVFLLYLSKMYKPIRELSKMTDTYSRALVAFERINNFLGVELEVRDRPGARRAPRFRGTIELDHVTFGYGPPPTGPTSST